jgi:hypothetical protein
VQGVFFLHVSFFCMPCLDLSHLGLPAHAACLQAANARQAADGAQQRLGQLQDRCAAEERRLAALQAAVLEQGQGFDAQVQSLLELGQQVRAAILGGRWLSTQQQQQQPPLWLL